MFSSVLILLREILHCVQDDISGVIIPNASCSIMLSEAKHLSAGMQKICYRLTFFQRLAKRFSIFHVIQAAEIFRITLARLYLEIDQDRAVFF
jgi:hypothetical protein